MCVCMYVCMHVCMHDVCMHVCMYVCMHACMHAGSYLGEIAPMASSEIAPLSKYMTPKLFNTITSAKKIMIMQLILAKYHYSWKVGELLFYLTKPKFKPLKMSIGQHMSKTNLLSGAPFKWHLHYLPYPWHATGCFWNISIAHSYGNYCLLDIHLPVLSTQ